MKQLSRRSLAQLLVSSYGEKDFSRRVLQVAAHMVETKRAKQIDLLVKDIEFEAQKQLGHTTAHIQSAHELTQAVRKQLIAYVKDVNKSSSVELIESIDTSLLGGVVIATPEMEVDLSLHGKLKRLKAIEL